MARRAYDWRRELLDAGEFADLTANLIAAAARGGQHR
jgi:hypothetical protein